MMFEDVEQISVDDTGQWGNGVIDSLSYAGCHVMPVVFSSSRAIKPKYYNRRDKMYTEMAESAKSDLRLPNIPEMGQELTSMTYGLYQGTLILESKDQVGARTRKSPDYSDAVALHQLVASFK